MCHKCGDLDLTSSSWWYPTSNLAWKPVSHSYCVASCLQLVWGINNILWPYSLTPYWSREECHHHPLNKHYWVTSWCSPSTSCIISQSKSSWTFLSTLSCKLKDVPLRRWVTTGFTAGSMHSNTCLDISFPAPLHTSGNCCCRVSLISPTSNFNTDRQHTQFHCSIFAHEWCSFAFDHKEFSLNSTLANQKFTHINDLCLGGACRMPKYRASCQQG